MALSLTFLGRCGDRWRVRVDACLGERPRGLTIGLVSGSGRPLGPAVVGPVEFESWVAELRGPGTLPSDAVVRATMDGASGELVEATVPVRARKGVHAWLHADHVLPLAARPKPSALTKKETSRLAAALGWLCGCPENDPPRPANGCPDELASLLADFDVDAATLDAETIARMRR